MKGKFRFVCSLIAIMLILGSISFSSFVKAEETSVEEANENQYSIRTTDESGEVVNGNVKPYETKSDVYVGIYGKGIPEVFYVRVISPGDEEVGRSGALSYNGHFNLYAVTSFDDTTNNGGVYKVEVSLSNSFKDSETKSDNFKIKMNVPEQPNITGSITVEKTIVNDNNVNITDDDTTFTFKLFKIVNGKDVPVETITINGNGTKPFEKKLEDGKYKISEINIPEDYEPDGNDIEVQISNGNVETVSFTNIKDTPDTTWKQGNIIVTKLKWGLPGRYGLPSPQSPKDITFRLVGENIEPMELTTGRTGIIVFDKLPEGKYTLTELIPEGYKSSIPENGYQIEIVRRKINLPITILVNNFQQPETEEDDTPPIDDEELPGDEEPPEEEDPPKEEDPPIDDDDDDYEEPTPPKPPKPDIEEEEVIEENIPEIIPEEIIEDEEEIVIEEEVPLDVPEIEEIPEIEEVPESVPTLPKTGAASDLAFYRLGSFFIGLGSFLRKKKTK